MGVNGNMNNKISAKDFENVQEVIAMYNAQLRQEKLISDLKHKQDRVKEAEDMIGKWYYHISKPYRIIYAFKIKEIIVRDNTIDILTDKYMSYLKAGRDGSNIDYSEEYYKVSICEDSVQYQSMFTCELENQKFINYLETYKEALEYIGVENMFNEEGLREKFPNWKE